MSRTLSAAAREALYGPQTDEVFLVLVVVSHADLPAPIRLVNNLQAVISGGNSYLPFPFAVELPVDQEEETQRVTLTVDNVSLELIDEVRSIASPFTVTLNVVLASSPDTLEAGPFEFTSTSCEYDVQQIVFTLSNENLLQEPFPGHNYAPTNYPSLFAAVDR